MDTQATLTQSTLSFGLVLTGRAPPRPSAVTQAVMAEADAAVVTPAPSTWPACRAARARGGSGREAGDNVYSSRALAALVEIGRHLAEFGQRVWAVQFSKILLNSAAHGTETSYSIQQWPTQ